MPKPKDAEQQAEELLKSLKEMERVCRHLNVSGDDAVKSQIKKIRDLANKDPKEAGRLFDDLPRVIASARTRSR